jgi:hypothetical protein
VPFPLMAKGERDLAAALAVLACGGVAGSAAAALGSGGVLWGLLLPLTLPLPLLSLCADPLPLLLAALLPSPVMDSLLLAAACVTFSMGRPAAAANTARSLTEGALGRDAAAASCACDAAMMPDESSDASREGALVSVDSRSCRKSFLACSWASLSSSSALQGWGEGAGGREEERQ